MTPRQKNVIEFIRDYYERTGLTPTYDEIAVGIGLKTKSGVYRMVDQLIAQGHLERGQTQTSRNLRLAVPKGHAFPNLASIPTTLLTAELARRERAA